MSTNVKTLFESVAKERNWSEQTQIKLLHRFIDEDIDGILESIKIEIHAPLMLEKMMCTFLGEVVEFEEDLGNPRFDNS